MVPLSLISNTNSYFDPSSARMTDLIVPFNVAAMHGPPDVAQRFLSVRRPVAKTNKGIVTFDPDTDAIVVIIIRDPTEHMMDAIASRSLIVPVSHHMFLRLPFFFQLIFLRSPFST